MRSVNSEIRALFRCVSPCVRFVEQRRVCTRPDCLRGVGHLSQFVGDNPFCQV